ncbi:aspartyl/asparaginyl beta-hydroxylase domain-containing protein [Pseudoalteromonas sp. MMG006]|uniref:aspartyl/asparaginyl beta-hydroxylase domain-containing protein n=1 Tax=unclassified Pseudoalteromonas TaxID=194690 RepID=UPI001B37D690|nr:MULTISPECIES: aspartyl/asparaginyl beta-hydroxylase domain-containing protein [unclassified Pseudoalteromonas]MBQ4800948.1 aspartyl/asparaginyl beta-hydroxylase domain-containing protein [Pseudoalteromonas sp. MMG006]MCH2089030.1 aspartyl/asparaginyl beta-hydroxylase domain-containing protein [Pseudoalteromonas sp.]
MLTTQSSTKKNGYYPVSDHPSLLPLEQNWQKIQEEFLAIDAPILDIHRYKKSFEEVVAQVFSHVKQGGEYGWLHGWGKEGPNKDWLQYGLVVQGRAVDGVDKVCPVTMSLLSGISGIKVAAFLTLKSNTFLPGHAHPEIRGEGLLQYHLTLDSSEKLNLNYLNVNGVFAQNKPGKAIVFDGSYYHFAVNASPKDRTILYIEFKKQVAV